MGTKTKILGFMLAAAVFSVPMMAYADNGGWNHHHANHMMARVLGLSDAQVKQLKDLHETQKTAIKGLFEQIKTNREAFEAEIAKATPDMNKVNDLQTQIKALQAQMVDGHLSSMLEVKKIMTPEQFAGYMALKKERQMMRRMMMEHGDRDGHKHWGDKEDNGDKGAGAQIAEDQG